MLDNLGHPFITGVVKKWWWRLLTIACSLMILYQLSMLTSQYLRYDVNVNRIVAHSNQLPFPAITVCSMCPMSKKALTDNPPMLKRMLADVANVKENKRVKRNIGEFVKTT